VAITAEVDQALTALDCAVLRSTVVPDRRVFVSGYVASAADVGRVQTVLRDIPRIEGVVADVKVLERPFCELLDVVERHAPPAGATDRGPGIKLNHASASYREGEFLVEPERPAQLQLLGRDGLHRQGHVPAHAELQDHATWPDCRDRPRQRCRI